MYIGIYGGTFNPIHFGHLRAAEEVCEAFKQTHVIFVPSANPPHKDKQDLVDPNHRLKMVNLAVTGNPRFQASEIEIQRRGKSYSIDTVRALKQSNPDDDFAFIMGLDAFLEIETWHKYDELFPECDFIVTTRPGSTSRSCNQAIPEAVRESFKRKKGTREFEHSSGRKLFFAEVTLIDVSASSIRDKVRKGESIRYLIPRRVMEYIHEHELYK